MFSRKNFAKCQIMNKKDRLEAIIGYYSDGKPSLFAKYIGVAPSTISSWLSRDTMDYDLLFAKCENISAEWLLSGQGDMISQSAKRRPPKAVDVPPESSILADMIREKDAKITEQAETIGALKEQIKQLQREKGKDVSDVRTSGVANAV